MAFQLTRSGPISQINMTPMIDLLLVMLIIFLVMAPVHPKGLQAAVPQPAPSTRAVEPETDLVVSIASDGSLKLNTHVVQRAQLGAALGDLFRTRRDKTIFVQGAGGLVFGQVAEVIDTATGAGAERVALITGG